MDNQKVDNQNESHTRATAAMKTEILERIAKFAADKRAGGTRALQGAVSFSFLYQKHVSLLGRLLQRRDSQPSKVKVDHAAWQVGSLMKLPASSLYIDVNGQGYIATTSHAPQHANEITLIIRESLDGMTYEQLEEIRALLRRSRG